MSVITRVEEPNLWEQICKEYLIEEKACSDDQGSVSTEYSDFDASKHHPAFYGPMHFPIATDVDAAAEFNPSVSHPACLGYAFVHKPLEPVSVPAPPSPDKMKSPPRQYLEHYVFPYLLPALQAMLQKAKLEKCFERKRTKFNALDHITLYLYRNNPQFPDRKATKLWDIPFVKDWLKDHPRPPVPLSLIWTEEEAAVVIQSHWRGYLIRRQAEIQELRQWQLEWRIINSSMQTRISNFWDSKMAVPVDNQETLHVNDLTESPLPESTSPDPGFETSPLPHISSNSNTAQLEEMSKTSVGEKDMV